MPHSVEISAASSVLSNETQVSIHPLSSVQQVVWLDQMLNPDAPHYNIGWTIQIDAAIDPLVLEQAIRDFVMENDAARLTLIKTEGMPQQHILPSVEFVLPVLDFSDETDADQHARDHLNQMHKQPFDLYGGLLWRMALIRASPTRYYWLLCYHHLIADGVSGTQSFTSIASAYNRLLGRDTTTAEAAPSYLDFIAKDQDYSSSARFALDEKFWRQRFTQLPARLVSGDSALSAETLAPSEQFYWSIERPLFKKMTAFAAAHGCSASDFMLALTSVYFARINDLDEVVIGVPIHGRSARDKNTFGMFSSIIPVGVALDRQQPFTHAMAAVAKELRRCYRHQRFPIAEINRAYNVIQNGYHQLFDVSLSFGVFNLDSPMGEGRASGFQLDHGFEQTPLAISVQDSHRDQDVLVVFDYNQRHFTRDDIVSIQSRMAILMEAIIDGADCMIDQLPLLTAAERHQIVTSWNATQVMYPEREYLLHQLIEAQAIKTPQAVAVEHGAEQLSYAELNAQANQLAHYLRELGVVPDDRVAICVDRGLAMVVGVLAILKSGAGYVPLDPAYPAERLAHMLSDSAPRVVLSGVVMQAEIAGGWEQVRATIEPDVPVLDLHAPSWRAYSNENPDSRHLTSSDLAYVIYTSGSTGMPKGVLNEHRGIVNRMLSVQQSYGMDQHDVALQKTSFSFDDAVSEIFWPLMAGAKLVMARQDGHKDLRYLSELIRSAGVTTLHFVPSMLQIFMGHADVASCTSLVRVMSGGEALPASLVHSFHAQLPHTRLHNLYGPSEAAVDVTGWTSVAGATATTIPIGKPIANTCIYILDAQGEPVPVGVAGELHIGGVQVARGYLNQPELTEQRFVPDPFSSQPGARLYKTGDLASWQSDGNLVYLGRNDFQVKMRGFRIELGEIETQLAAHPAIRETVVMAREDIPGDQRLVAYMVVNHEVDVEALRAHLSLNLPDYMVPAAYVTLAALPLTASGKLDRKSLPAPDGAAYAVSGYVAPKGETETMLSAIWSELLQIERIGRHDNFFSLGGHSLLAITLIQRMREHGMQAEVRALFATPTVAGLAAAIGAESRLVTIPVNLIPVGCSAITPAMLPLVALNSAEIARVVEGVPGGAANVQDIYPLAPLQEGILFHHLMARQGDPYLLVGLTSFDTRARLDAYLSALEDVIQRHDALRTAFVWEGVPEPLQVVWRSAPLMQEELILDPADGDVVDQLRARFDPRHIRLDLSQAPLLRTSFAFDTVQRRWILLTLDHHLVSDHITLEVIDAEIAAHLQGQEAQLPVPLQFRNYVAQTKLGANTEANEAFFRQMLGDVDAPTAPFGLLEVHGDGDGMDEGRLPLSVALSQRIRAQARQLGVSAASLCHLAWAQVLARVANGGTRSDVVFGTVLFGRMGGGEGARQMMGLLMNTLPLRINIDDQGVAASVRRTHTLLSALMEHEHASLALALRASAIVAPQPLFSALLNYRHSMYNTSSPIWEGITQIAGEERSNYPLTMSIDDLGTGFTLTVQVTPVVGALRVCRFMETALEGLVTALETTPERAINSIDVLPAMERHQLVTSWNTTQIHYPERACLLHQLVEAQAAQTPHAVAVASGAVQLSYAELNAQANQLAHYLRELGVGPDDRVAICVDRGLAMVVGLLGVLKAGAGYVPLDPGYPAERLMHMLADSAPRVVLSGVLMQAGIAGGWEQARATIAPDVPVLDLHAPSWGAYPTENPDSSHLKASDLAYVIYTSGSTGQPKGVMNEHCGVVNRMLWMQQAYGLEPRDVVLQKTPFSFDVSVWEFFWPLMVGAKLVMAKPDGHKDPHYLSELIRTAGVTTLHFVPSMLQVFTGHQDAASCTSIVRVMCSGEALPAALVQRFHAQLPDAQLHNLYGPTEAAVDVTAEACVAGATDALVPIGTPIANTSIYILDAQGKPTPVGVAGELHIGGVQVARGYLNQPELTEQRFVPDPFSSQPGARLYKSGDLARWQSDGNLVYLGRNDFQVKIRGFRIELGEIETQLVAHPAIREAVVMAREDNAGDQRLVAYMVVNHKVDIEVLRAHLSLNLPDYMVPAAYVTLAALPLNVNGKLDRKALPTPDGAAYTMSGYVAPIGETETTLVAIWSELLQIERIGRHDNFFSLGGHSLLAITLIQRMREHGMQAEVRALFLTPTVAALAAVIGAESRLVTVPENLIPAGCSAITPAMLPLVALSSTEIACVVGSVPGGAANVQDIYPLAPLQEGILFHHLMARQGDPYLLVALTSFDTRARLDAYLSALEGVIRRHDALRTAFVWEGVPEPLQVVWRSAPLVREELILDPADGDVVDQLRARFDPRHIRLDLSQAPLLRTSFAFDAVQRRWVLLTLLHHLVNDHTTLEVIDAEIAAHLQGQEAQLPVPLQFRNYVAQTKLGANIEADEAFFRQMLGDVDAPTAPFGLLEVHGDGIGLEEAQRELNTTLSQRLRQQARQLGVSAASLCHLAWAQVLARVANRSDVVFGTVLFGRMEGGEGARQMMGLLINTLPLRINIDHQGIAASVRQTHALLAELMAHEHASLALAQRASAIAAPQPLFSALLNYRHSMYNATSPIWEGVTQIAGEERSNYPLTLSIDDLGTDFALTVQVTPAIGALRVCSFMETALEGLVTALEITPERSINSIDVLPAMERHQLVTSWNTTQVRYSKREYLLHHLFEAQAIRTPYAVAVASGAEQLSYAELNAQANQLAHYLRELGIQPDDRVAICVDRGLAMVVGLLAVLKAGAGYVPLDPAYPAERLAYMLSDSAPRVVLSGVLMQAGITGGWEQARVTIAPDVPVLDLHAPSWDAYPSENPDSSHLTSSDLAYVIYTSGSTGQPKGVMNEHRAVVNLMYAMQQAYGLERHDVILQKTPFSFDVSVCEFFWPLMVGAKLVMARPDGHKDLRYLSDIIRTAGVTTLQFVPSMLQVFVGHAQTEAVCTSVVRVLCAGEALPAALVQRFHAQLPHAQLHNLYGPTEAAVYVTAEACVAGATDALVPIGTPIANTSIYILDAQGKPTPVGVAGELHIGGVQVARGYLNQPELTEQRFVPDPFSSQPGARLYKSGDLARWQSDGNLVYLGRNDFQVKIRGFRIELGEIETQLVAHPAIREAVVMAREDNAGDQRLVAYMVVNHKVDIEVLRAHLSLNLPDYMVPAAYVTLAALPLNVNGKLDRKALPTPDGAAYTMSGYVAPIGETETTLVAIWSELLQIERIGRHDNFFSLGGHSLLAITLIQRMREHGMQAEVRALFLTPTVAALAAVIGAESRLVTVPENLIPAGCSAITPAMLPLVALSSTEIACVVGSVPGGAANVQDIYPLAPLQEGILFHHLMARQGDPYLLVALTSFDTRARLDAYLSALEGVIRRHDALRTAFVWEGVPEPLQVVWRSAPLVREELILDPADGDVVDQLRARFDPRHIRLDLSQAPLLRTSFAFDAVQRRWVLLTLLHHLVNDHTTLEVIDAEIAAHLQGQEAQLPVPLQFRNYVAQTKLGANIEADEAFFRQMLGDVDAPTAPFGLLEVHGDGIGLEEAQRELNTTLSQRLRQQARQLGVSAASLCHLAWAQVLARVANRSDVVFGTVLFGRMEGGEGARQMMGLLINTLPLRINIDHQGVAASVRQTHALLAELMAHEHASLALAQRASAIAAPQPLFSALLNYRHSMYNATSPIWEGVTQIAGEERSNYPLTLSIDDLGTDFALTVQVTPAIGALRVCSFMETALEGLVTALEITPERSINSIDVLPAMERHQLVTSWNTTQIHYPERACLLHQLVEAQAAQTPQAMAVEHGVEQLNYAELNHQANQLAHYLRELGVQPDDRVAICVDRGLAMVVGLLAVLKSGAGYVPLDPAYPAERLMHMLADSAPRVVLSGVLMQAGIADGWEQARTTIAPDVPVLDLHAPSWGAYPTENPDSSHLKASDLAYVIYTSGSTGQPKGVMNEHCGVVNRMLWMQQAYGLEPRDVVLQKTPFSFDVSVWEFFWPLMVGAKLVMAKPDGHKDPHYLSELIRTAGVTTLHFVPSMLQAFTGHEDTASCTSIVRVMSSGEALPAALVQRFHAQLPDAQLHNLYGPTEAAVDVTAWTCVAGATGTTIPIGKPIANTRIYILDAQGEPTPVGVAGELHIGGVQVARGYLNQLELTEQRFVPDPFSSQPGARLYKTGDLARWQSDGNLVYLGRNDFQVKIRGFRIELAEIETQLAAHPAIREAVVMAREDSPGDQRLVAYIVINTEIDAATLRTHLSVNLPDYMVPAAYVTLAALPLTPNGKLDRKALPAPDGAAYAVSGYVTPEGETEIILARIWSELLQIERIGRHDNFFSLGGHSLLAITLIQRMREHGMQAEVRALFLTPTVAALAAVIGAESRLVTVPENLIPAGCSAITPAMLPLVALSSTEIACVVGSVPGGAANVQDIYPLAPLQEGILFHHLMARQGDPYLLVALTSFDTRARLDAYLSALEGVIRRHDALRTAFVWEGVPEPLQVVWRSAPLVREELILDPADGDVVDQLRARFDPRHIRLDLSQAPLLRIIFAFDAAQRRWVLLTLLHHLVSDHVTLEVIDAEIAAHLQGQEAQLPVPLQFRNYVAQTKLGANTEAHEAFFRQMLGDVDAPTAPFGLLEVHGDGIGLEEAQRELNTTLSQRLRQQARQLGVSAASLCHLAWAQVLARVSNRSDVVFGTVLFGRMGGDEGVQQMMGLLINTLPLRINIDQQGAAASVRQTHALLAELMEHEHASLALAQRASAIAAPQPLFSALLNYRHSLYNATSPIWESVTQIAGEERSNYPLTMSIDDLGTDFALTVQVTAAVGALRVCRFMETALEGLVTALETTPERAINSIDVLPAMERHQLVTSWNATQIDYPERACLLHQLVEAQAAQTPQAMAVEHGAERLSYTELNRQANQLAHYLRELGVQPDDRVAICVDRGLAMVVGLLAVLKSGAGYVPLDPAYPAERLAHMLADSAPRVVLTQAGIVGGWEQARVTIAQDVPVLDLHAPSWGAYPSKNPDSSHLTSSHLAYVIYTSGSTGIPKGVMNEHRSIVNHMLWMQQAYGLEWHDVVLQKTPFSFDASVWEFFVPLMVGAKLVMARPDGHKDLCYLSDIIRTAGVTTLQFVPLMLQVFIDLDTVASCTSIVRVMCGGEVLPAALVQRFHAQLPDAQLHNLYGPTEAAVDVTAWTCVAGATGTTIPIGKPIANTRIYILDAQGEPTPVGVAGELHIGGVQVARGYLNQPELTEQRFVPDPFSSQPGARLYKTGDLARWQSDGNLVYLGRNDFQVKIRGFRIELAEIETQLAAHPAIREAVVMAREDSPGDQRLVAYIVVNTEIDATTLRTHLSVNLPDYMVPAAYVTLAALPLTANGKLDRKSLPAPDGAAYALSGYVAPESETEITLAAIWSELLQTERIGRHDNFFALGGHSLLAMQLMSRLRKTFGIEVALSTLFAQPVLAAFSAELLKSGVSTRPLLTATTGAERELLSFAQQRLWFLEQMGGVGQAYHIPVGLQLNGHLDRVALRQTLERLVFRHEALRTHFTEKDGHTVQHVTAADVSHFQLLEHDLRHHPERDIERERIVAEEAVTPFDLVHGRLIRARLLQESATQHTLLITLHHIVSDGWSMGVLFNEMSALYNAYRQGQHDPLPALSVQYPDYAAWQRRWMCGAVLEQQTAYWRDALADAPSLLEVPTDHPRPSQQDYAGASIETTLDAALTHKLKVLSQRHGTTLHMTLLSSWAMLLGRLAGQDDVVIGTPTANRTQQEVEGLIGLFVNTLALRIRLPEQATVAMLLAQVKQQSLAAQQHQDIPFEQVVEHTQPVRSMAHSPLFQVMFAWENVAQGQLSLEGLTLTPVPLAQVTAKFDLTLTLGESEDVISGTLEYATALFERRTIERYLGYWQCLLAAMVEDDAQQIACLPILSAAERHQLVTSWNATQVIYPERAYLLHQLVEEQAMKTPHAVAVVSGAEQLNYAELNHQANQLAHYLRESGVVPDDRVVICVDRGLAMVVGLLAVLKSGAGYVPLDPAYPAERLMHMLADSAPRVVLSGVLMQAGIADGWEQARTTIAPDVPVLDLHAPSWGAYPTENPDSSHLTSSDLAYVIYTSGSTGQPKGVMNEHRGVVNRMLWMQQAYGLEPHDVVLQKTPFSFDVSVWEFFWPLMVGAKLVMAKPDGHKDPHYLSELIRTAGVTTLHFVPSMLQAFTGHEDTASCTSIVRVMCSGEALPAALVQRFHAQLPDAQLHNLYGPTEAAVDVTAWTCVAGATGTTIPIGKPIANTRIYILDAQGEPTPVGVAGELHIGGVQVARGYLNQLELTEQRFVPDPFSSQPGARLYKTGDLARWQSDGNLVYLGRNDFQVKIRGFRIELAEIETQLAAHPAIREAVVMAREDSPGDQRLVAYIVINTEIDAATLRTHLSVNLPDYMVPAAYVTLAALPLTANGKLDRKSLPAPDGAAYALSGYVAPESETEITLAAIWSELLQTERIGRHDNFFALGGHSLLAMQLMSRLRKTFGIEVALSTLFAQPVLAAFSAELLKSGVSTRPLLTATTGAERELLSFAQQRLWFLEQMGGVGQAYHIPVGLQLNGHLDRVALRQTLERLVFRHEALRTHFTEKDGHTVQHVTAADVSHFQLLEHDLRHHPERDIERERIVAEEAVTPFDLVHGRLIRARLLQESATQHTLLITLHHIVSDGWSMGVLFNEMSALYNAYRQGQHDPLPALSVQYPDYAAWQRRWMCGAVLEQQTAYWRDALADAPSLLEVPTDHPRPSQQDYAGASIETTLDAALTHKLKVLSQRHGTTLHMTLLSSWAMLLGRLAGQDDVVIGTPTANRTQQEVEGLIGLFVNTLALRIRLPEQATVAMLLAQVKQQSLAAQQHQDIPFEQVVEHTQPVRSMAHSPLFQVMFAWENVAQGQLSLEGLTLTPVPLAQVTAKFDLTLTLGESEDVISGTLEYATALFERRTIERYLGYWQCLLAAMVEDDAQQIACLPILSAAERHQLVTSWNATQVIYPERAYLLHQLVEEQAMKTPHAVAVVSGAEQLNYAELNHQANQLAHYLRESGVVPDDRVVICVDRGLAMVVGVLAILKSGAGYVPLDPAYPAERLVHMLRDSAPRVVLSGVIMQAGIAGGWEQARATIAPDVPVLDLHAPSWRAYPSENPDSSHLTSSDLAYVIYTSGSTGMPKGVLNEHRGIVNRMLSVQQSYGMDQHDVALQKTSFSFDDAVSEIFWPLMAGAKLVMARQDGHKDLCYLSELIRSAGVTTLHFVPSMLQVFIGHDDVASCTSLTRVMSGGEALPASLVHSFHAQLPHARLHNLYGPSEAAVDVTAWTCVAGATGTTIPIGKPIANTRIYILDAQGEPTPVGVAGELHIGGVQVARGYLNQRELTEKRFVPDPFSSQSDARLYKTGDLARWQSDGNLVYLGRNDFQVKIRGFRIELGEIETQLVAHPGVCEAVVMAREDIPGDQRLVAYIVVNTEIDATTLRTHLSVNLPDYMVPAAYVTLAALPLTANGKLDHKSLPAPDGAAYALSGYVAPESETEITLAAIWSELLQTERIGRHDNFFALGGHSLSTLQVVNLLKQQHMLISASDVFMYPTVATLAERIAQAGLQEEDRLPILIRVGGTKQPLFLMHEGAGLLLYAHALAACIDTDIPIYGLPPVPFSQTQQFTTMHSMAQRMVGLIRRVQTKGPYRLAGWSFGGVLAYEVAQQLIGDGEQVEFLGLFDTAIYFGSKYISTVDDKNLLLDLIKPGLNEACTLKLAFEKITLAAAEVDVVTLVKTARKYGIAPVFLLSSSDQEIPAVMARIRVLIRAFDDYVAQPISIPVHLYSAESDAAYGPRRGWELILSEAQLRLVPVPGTHQSMMEDGNIVVLGQALDAGLRAASVQSTLYGTGDSMLDDELI